MADITDEKSLVCWLILDGFYAVISWSRWETKPANYQLDQAGRPKCNKLNSLNLMIHVTPAKHK